MLKKLILRCIHLVRCSSLDEVKNKFNSLVDCRTCLILSSDILFKLFRQLLYGNCIYLVSLPFGIFFLIDVLPHLCIVNSTKILLFFISFRKFVSLWLSFFIFHFFTLSICFACSFCVSSSLCDIYFTVLIDLAFGPLFRYILLSNMGFTFCTFQMK